MKIILILFLTIFAFADADKYEYGHHIRKDLYFLNLSAVQKAEVKIIIKDYQKLLRKLHDKEEKFEEYVKNIFQKKQFDKELFIKHNLEIKKEVVIIEADFFSKIHKVLNTEQRNKFREYLEEWEIE